MLNFCNILVAILKIVTGKIFQCQESIRDIIIYPHMKWCWKRTMLNLCGIVVAILKMATGRKFFNVGNQFRISFSTHISNFDDIGQCWIFAVLWWPFWKWQPVEIVQCQDSILDIIIYPHIKLWWYRTMLNFCDNVSAILKMATSRNCSMSGINSRQHYLPSSNFDDIGQCWIFDVLWWPF